MRQLPVLIILIVSLSGCSGSFLGPESSVADVFEESVESAEEVPAPPARSEREEESEHDGSDGIYHPGDIFVPTEEMIESLDYIMSDFGYPPPPLSRCKRRKRHPKTAFTEPKQF